MPTYQEAIDKARAYAAGKAPTKHLPNTPQKPTKGVCPHCGIMRHVLFTTLAGILICNTCIGTLKFAYGDSWEKHVAGSVIIARNNRALKQHRKEARAAAKN